nr:immunoglobulin light chain junction region [Macaca mulatta]MOX17952.1 immunoglobulin light chain junction region [Macaca mulatta]MOX19040.1 immunoglobulin light chain junction region [Macaca mulatta]MOX19177.1 immunoglobulin light chain junction region [Macaca mulatta]MOX19290.1 immunoglobulin light chain junction region [Macaca mulatta]
DYYCFSTASSGYHLF